MREAQGALIEAQDVLSKEMYAELRSAIGIMKNMPAREEITAAFELQGLSGEILEAAVAEEITKQETVSKSRFKDLSAACDKWLAEMDKFYE